MSCIYIRVTDTYSHSGPPKALGPERWLQKKLFGDRCTLRRLRVLTRDEPNQCCDVYIMANESYSHAVTLLDNAEACLLLSRVLMHFRLNPQSTGPQISLVHDVEQFLREREAGEGRGPRHEGRIPQESHGVHNS